MKLSGAQLVERFTSPSARIRLAAQRELLQRDVKPVVSALEKIAASTTAPLASRVLAIFTLSQSLGERANVFLQTLTRDASVAAWAIRALTDHEGRLARVSAVPMLAGLKSADARTRLESVLALARLGHRTHAPAVAKLLGDADAVIGHTVVKALVRLNDSAACFAVVDDVNATPAARTGALRVLQALHEENVVDGLIARLNRETVPARRDEIVRALCR